MLKIDKTYIHLKEGESLKLNINVSGEAVWESSDASYASVDNEGNINGVAEGYSLISVKVNEETAYCAVSVHPKEEIYTTHQGNSYLPLWEHIPDGEPYVFEDPENKGKYRVYIYGSHDIFKVRYCGDDLVVWSAPVEDLTQWRYDGVILRSDINGEAATIFAPDVTIVEENGTKTYYLYPNIQNWGRNNMAAKSDRPDGPFIPCNWVDGNITQCYGPIGFDPAVIYDNGKVYGYWGFKNSYWAELDPENMADLISGETPHRNLPCRDECDSEDFDPKAYNIYDDEDAIKWGFFEASSIRKVGNKYVFVYSRNGLRSEPTGLTFCQLAYGYSDSPAGPWKWGGIIVDAAGEAIPGGEKGHKRTYMGGNTHGSICEANGQWYVFYHKNYGAYARQATVEEITVDWDEKPVSEGGEVRISMAEVTSNGFFINGLNPYREHAAQIACYLTGHYSAPYIYDKTATDFPIELHSNNSIVGFKYLNFSEKRLGEGKPELVVNLVPTGARATVDIFLRPKSAVNTPVVEELGKVISVGDGSYKLGTIELAEGLEQKKTAFKLDASEIEKLDGEWGLFFVFSNDGGKVCDFVSFEFK